MTKISPDKRCSCGGVLVLPAVVTRFIVPLDADYACLKCGRAYQWKGMPPTLKQMPDGAWLLSVELKHGHHRYAFLVDGTLTLDPRAQGITRNDKGERVSLVPVS